MYDNYNYPPGADGPDAPWNQVDLEPREIEVTVSITLSKTVKVEVDDYSIEDDDEGGVCYDYSECDLEKVVKEQIILPQEAYLYINGSTSKGKAAIEDLKSWEVDDYEVIRE